MDLTNYIIPIFNSVKKAYYQQSILWHPDRFSSAQHNDADRDMATKKFQIIGKVYSILSDKQKRKIYDETGCP
jgi:DnaJ family protein C protein 9